jgi:hypothetical protein
LRHRLRLRLFLQRQSCRSDRPFTRVQALQSCPRLRRRVRACALASTPKCTVSTVITTRTTTITTVTATMASMVTTITMVTATTSP